jgi:hypothetical protein
MTPQNVDTTDLRRSEYESACRGFWLAYVKLETGDLPESGAMGKQFDGHAATHAVDGTCGCLARNAGARVNSENRI